MPPGWPAQSWRDPAVCWISGFTTDRTALPKMRLATSQIPMGRTPGFLSRGISRHAAEADIVAGSITSQHRRRPRSASAPHSSSEWRLKAVQMRRQFCVHTRRSSSSLCLQCCLTYGSSGYPVKIHRVYVDRDPGGVNVNERVGRCACCRRVFLNQDIPNRSR